MDFTAGHNSRVKIQNTDLFSYWQGVVNVRNTNKNWINAGGKKLALKDMKGSYLTMPDASSFGTVDFRF